MFSLTVFRRWSTIWDNHNQNNQSLCPWLAENLHHFFIHQVPVIHGPPPGSGPQGPRQMNLNPHPQGLCYAKSLQSYPTLCDPVVALKVPLSRGLSRQEYWSGLPCPPPDPEIEPMSLTSPALVGRVFTTSATWEVHFQGLESSKFLVKW